MTQFAFLAGLGLLVGGLGTLVGAGGGFILMPILMILRPDLTPEVVTGVSLTVVFLNALSGSLGALPQKRIDYKSGLVFALAGLPAAALGVYSVRLFPKDLFEALFGGLLCLGAALLAHKSFGESEPKGPAVKHHLRWGAGLSFVFSYFAGLFGIGGGILQVPAMVHWLKYPISTATATSQFTLIFISFAGGLIHFLSGHLMGAESLILGLAPGVLVGAQLGAFLGVRIRGRWILLLLSLFLFATGLKLIFGGLGSPTF